MAVAEVKTLYPSNFRDVAKTLRHIADEVEKGETGEYGIVKSGAIVLLKASEQPPGEIDVFGLGEGDFWRHLGILQAGAVRLARMLK